MRIGPVITARLVRAAVKFTHTASIAAMPQCISSTNDPGSGAWTQRRSRSSWFGAASFVGIERITGTVGGRSGTFLLQDAGTVQGSIVSGDWFVIPGSGTGQLAGLRGEGGFRANLGEGAQVHLDYWFD